MELNPNLDVFSDTIPVWERGQHGGRTRPINREVLFNNLVQVKEVFDKHEIKFCLSHGTMLGIWRDGNFIPWDDDVDIALFISDKDKFPKAIDELRNLGFFIPPCNPSPQGKANPNTETPYYDFVAIKDGEKIEGWFFEKIGKYYIYDFPRCGNDLKHDEKYYDELADMKWKDVIWKIPNHIEDWLVMMYGKSWNIPQPERKYNNQKFDKNGKNITNVS